MAEHDKAKMSKLIFYDEENDILSVHKGFLSDEKFKGNIDVGDLILDISTRGRIKGFEVMNASNFFKEFNVGKEILKNIIDAKFDAQLKLNSIIVGIIIKAKNVKNEIPAKIAVPLETPIVC